MFDWKWALEDWIFFQLMNLESWKLTRAWTGSLVNCWKGTKKGLWGFNHFSMWVSPPRLDPDQKNTSDFNESSCLHSLRVSHIVSPVLNINPQITWLHIQIKTGCQKSELQARDTVISASSHPRVFPVLTSKPNFHVWNPRVHFLCIRVREDTLN